MQDLSITLIQSDLKWQDKSHNLDHFEKCIHAIDGTTDIIILPEMFSTGFSMKPAQLAESLDGESVEWMKRMAKDKQAAICGSLIIHGNPDRPHPYVNKFIWIEPNGHIQTYDKHHLFSLVNEFENYQQGNNHLIIQYKNWTIQPFICYDLRFPAWCRNKHGVDLQIYVANWPEKRSEHWKTLLKARAIENVCYVAGVNRIGNDDNDVYHSGDSSVFDYAGKELFTVEHEPKIHTVSISKFDLHKFRDHFPFLDDADEFKFI